VAIPVMVEKILGVIVTIGSINGRLPLPMVTDCSAAKAAFNNLAKALSKKAGPPNVRVNMVDPGPVATHFWADRDGWRACSATPAVKRPNRSPRSSHRTR